MSTTKQFTEQSEYLGVFTQVPPERLKPFAETILEGMGDIQVLTNRTGLVMLPYTDTVQGTVFHLGEVLVAEARIQWNGREGYGACLGRDLEHAMAVAVLDAAMQGNHQRDSIVDFVQTEYNKQQQEEEDLLRRVEATRVDMETFV